MSKSDTQQQNGIESENSTTNNEKPRCISCGERRVERCKITLHQPLHGNGYGRLIETGSICSRCVSEMRHNARKESGE